MLLRRGLRQPGLRRAGISAALRPLSLFRDDGALLGSLTVRAEAGIPAALDVVVRPTWGETVAVDFEGGQAFRLEGEDIIRAGTNERAGTLRLSHRENASGRSELDVQLSGSGGGGGGADDDGAAVVLSIECPKQQNVDVRIGGPGSIDVVDKLEGDTKLFAADGDVRLRGTRGEVIDLQAPRGSVHCAGLLEGDMRVGAGRRVDVKKMNSRRVEVRNPQSTAELSSVKVRAIYAAQVSIEGDGDVAVDTIHGEVEILAAGDVSVGGITGSAPLIRAGGDLRVHLDALEGAAAGGAMELAATGAALLSVAEGLDLDVRATHASSRVPEGLDAGDPPAREALPDGRHAFAGVPAAAREPSPAAAVTPGGGGVGKIDIRGAADQKFDTFFSSGAAGGGGGRGAGAARPRVRVSGSEVCVESVSWKERIYRSFERSRGGMGD